MEKSDKQKLKEKFSSNIPLVLILFAGIILRILFFRSINRPILTSDSETYIGGAKNLLKYLTLDEYRPPVYLIQLIVCGLIFTWQNLQIGTIIVQNILGLLNVVIIYRLVKEAFGSKLAAYISAFFTAISITIYCWDFMILTENLSMFLVTLSAYYLVVYLKYNNNKHLKMLFAVLLICVFTKPFFMVLPVLVAIILLIRQLGTKGFHFNTNFKTAALGLAGIYLSIVIYSGVNQIQHSFFGITTVGKVNTFGKILQYNMEDHSSNKKLVNNVKEAFTNTSSEYVVDGKFLEPWHFIGRYGLNTNHYLEVGSFAHEIILKRPIEYTFKSLKLTWELLTHSPFKDFIAESEILKADHPDRIMLAVKKITGMYDFLYLAILLLGIEILYLLIRHRSWLLCEDGFFFSSIFLLILYHYLISAFFSYGDYSRLLAPCYPLIYAVIAVYISKVLTFAAKKITYFIFS